MASPSPSRFRSSSSNRWAHSFNVGGKRIGHIHHYRQEHDRLIFNFVAANTRQGQVLDRLREIRAELGTDQVFDVVGDIFPANQLEKMFRDLYAGRTTQQALLERIVRDLDIERFRCICISYATFLVRCFLF